MPTRARVMGVRLAIILGAFLVSLAYLPTGGAADPGIGTRRGRPVTLRCVVRVHLVRRTGVQDYIVTCTVKGQNNARIDIGGQAAASSHQHQRPPVFLYTPETVFVHGDSISAPLQSSGNLRSPNEDGVAAVPAESWVMDVPIFPSYWSGLRILKAALWSDALGKDAGFGGFSQQRGCTEMLCASLLQIAPGVAVKRVVRVSPQGQQTEVTYHCLDQRDRPAVDVCLQVRPATADEPPYVVHETMTVHARTVPVEQRSEGAGTVRRGNWLRDAVNVTTTYVRLDGWSAMVPRLVEWRDAKGNIVGSLSLDEYQTDVPVPDSALGLSALPWSKSDATTGNASPAARAAKGAVHHD